MAYAWTIRIGTISTTGSRPVKASHGEEERTSETAMTPPLPRGTATLRRPAVKSPGVVFDGYRVIFVSGQALSAGMVGAVTSSLVDSVVVGRMRQRARTSRPRYR